MRENAVESRLTDTPPSGSAIFIPAPKPTAHTQPPEGRYIMWKRKRTKASGTSKPSSSSSSDSGFTPIITGGSFTGGGGGDYTGGGSCDSGSSGSSGGCD